MLGRLIRPAGLSELEWKVRQARQRYAGKTIAVITKADGLSQLKFIAKLKVNEIEADQHLKEVLVRVSPVVGIGEQAIKLSDFERMML